MGRIRDRAQEQLDLAKAGLEHARQALAAAEQAFDQAVLDDAKPDCEAVLPKNQPCKSKAAGHVTVWAHTLQEDGSVLESYVEIPVCRLHSWRELERQMEITPGARCSIIIPPREANRQPS